MVLSITASQTKAIQIPLLFVLFKNNQPCTSAVFLLMCSHSSEVIRCCAQQKQPRRALCQIHARRSLSFSWCRSCDLFTAIQCVCAVYYSVLYNPHHPPYIKSLTPHVRIRQQCAECKRARSAVHSRQLGRT